MTTSVLPILQHPGEYPAFAIWRQLTGGTKAVQHHAKILFLLDNSMIPQRTFLRFLFQFMRTFAPNLFEAGLPNSRVPTAACAVCNTAVDHWRKLAIASERIHLHFIHPLSDNPKRATSAGTLARLVENNGEVPFLFRT